MSSQRVAILERALRWYANPKNWSEDDWGCRAVITHPDYGEGGKKARNALKRAERAATREACPATLLHSALRVAALAEVNLRYGAVVRGLSDAVADVIPDVHGGAALKLERATADVEAQLAAIDDALTRALEDLPEGKEVTDPEETPE